MSLEDPQIGETWTNSNEVGVIIARGSNAVRLMARSGRRVTLPLRSLQLLWKLSRDAPQLSQAEVCSRCGEEAFFRIPGASEMAWVCESHILGGPVYFPGDNPQTMNSTEIECPACLQRHSVQVEFLRLERLREGNILCNTCPSCSTTWTTLIGRNDGTDGHWFAESIPEVIEALQGDSKGEIRIYVDFVAHNSIQRAVGFSRGEHLHGQPLIENDRFGSNSVVVVFQTDPSIVTSGTPEVLPKTVPHVGTFWRLTSSGYILKVQSSSETEVTLKLHHNRGYLPIDSQEEVTLPLEVFHRDYEAINHSFLSRLEKTLQQAIDSNPFPLKSVWRRRGDRLILCAINRVDTSVGVPYIHYDIMHPTVVSGYMVNMMAADQFEEHWVRTFNVEEALKNNTIIPNHETFWRKVVTNEVVRILPPMPGSNPQVVRYQKRDSTVETFPLKAFQRLYKELPSPVRGYWVKDGKLYKPVSLQGVDYENAQVTLVDELEQTHVKSLFEMLSTYDPMFFTEEASKEIADINLPLIAQASWTGPRGETAVIQDFGNAEGQTYVRFTQEAIPMILPLKDFLDRYQGPQPPCQIGEEWRRKSQKGEETLDTIYRVTQVSQRYSLVTLRGPGPEDTYLGFISFLRDYEKLERKRLFELLEDD